MNGTITITLDLAELDDRAVTLAVTRAVLEKTGFRFEVAGQLLHRWPSTLRRRLKRANVDIAAERARTRA